VRKTSLKTCVTFVSGGCKRGRPGRLPPLSRQLHTWMPAINPTEIHDCRRRGAGQVRIGPILTFAVFGEVTIFL
jgi:hypothetical protein